MQGNVCTVGPQEDETHGDESAIGDELGRSGTSKEDSILVLLGVGRSGHVGVSLLEVLVESVLFDEMQVKRKITSPS
jgi:hypothetical protein